MPVNLVAPNPQDLLPVHGIRVGYAKAHIKKPNRKDLLLVEIAPGSTVAGVFTRNRFCAAPVTVAREHLANGGEIRALIINTGNANAGTGEAGLAAARQTCAAVAELLGVLPQQVLPFSTGVILEPLPLERLVAGLPQARDQLSETDWLSAAEAIMTTDIVPKAISRQVLIQGETVTITGIAKGSGMIHPNMATMLGFVATDARLSPALLQHALSRANADSFNAITVDGDTSTNDACIAIATGQAMQDTLSDADSADFAHFYAAFCEVMLHLAKAIVRDGEGATKFMTVAVKGGQSREECRQVAYAIARSPLVKTAFFASDPNLGRLLAAIGYAGIEDLDVRKVKLYLDEVLVAENGGRAESYQEADGQRIMQQAEILVHVDLQRGSDQATVYTCDFSYDYVKINAEYRS